MLKKYSHITAGACSLIIHALAFFIILPNSYMLKTMKSLTPQPRIKAIPSNLQKQDKNNKIDEKKFSKVIKTLNPSNTKKNNVKINNTPRKGSHNKEKVKPINQITSNTEKDPIVHPSIHPFTNHTIDSYDKYLSKLKKSIEKNVKYPKFLKNTGATGKVILETIIDKDGNIVNINIVSSFGGPLFDKEALIAAKKSSPFPCPPESIFKVQIPIVFKSKK